MADNVTAAVLQMISGVTEEELTTNERWTLVALAFYANEKGICYKRQRTLARYLRLTERQLRSVLRSLENKTIITKGNGMVGKRSANYYYINTYHPYFHVISRSRIIPAELLF